MKLALRSTLHATIILAMGPPLAIAEYAPLIRLDEDVADLEVVGASANARTGYAIATGDFNGDGLADIVVSADGRQPMGGSRKGEYYMFWGGATPTSGHVDLTNSPIPTRVFGRSDDFPLFCTLNSCDLNSDGYDDLFIGTPMYSNSKGRGYLLLGRPVWPDTVDLQLSPPGLISFATAVSFASLGFAACSLDFNGDGKDDLAVSAPGTSYGEIYVVLGAATLPASYDLSASAPGVVGIVDNGFNQFAGASLASGDFDRDGRDDLVFGGPGQASGTYDGVVTILYGVSASDPTIVLANYLGRVKRLRGEYTHARLGEVVRTADLNADGQSDLVASAPYADPGGCLDCGETYAIYDVEELPLSGTTADVTIPMTRIRGTANRTHYGVSLACGDVTGDGLLEIVIAGTSLNSPFPENRDTVAVVYGNLETRSEIVISSDTMLTRVVSENYSDDLGKAIATVDMNGDGLADLVVGSYSWDNESILSVGKVYFFLGKAQGTGTGSMPPPIMRVGDPAPNPLGETTRVDYDAASSTPVTARIYDVRGKLVRATLAREGTATRGAFVWDGTDERGRSLSAGVYFISIGAGMQRETRKIVLVR